MPSKRRATIEDLRLAIDCLPRTTRIAMLEGIRGNDIVVGAYSHGGGICPMLAAHRAGGRTNLISFARAWDRFAFGRSRSTRPRRASERELRVLVAHLEASLLSEEVPSSVLGAAIESHHRLLADHERRASPRPGDPDRSRELRKQPGWRWMRIVRRYDEYERALRRVQAEQDALTEQDALHAAASPELVG